MYRYLEHLLAQRVLECLERRHPGNALNFSDLGPNGFGNFQGSRAQSLGKGKHGNGEVAKLDPGRLFDYDARQGDTVMTPRKTVQHSLGEKML